MGQYMTLHGTVKGIYINSIFYQSEKFLVSSGFMPSGSVLFDKTGLQLYLIAQHHVNFIKWAPQGNIVCFAGFGNLPGEIEIWDMDNLKQIGKCRKDKVILFEWSPCSNFFLVATTFPRLRVNNMIQVSLKIKLK